VALKVDQIIGRRVLSDFCTTSNGKGGRLCISLIGSDLEKIAMRAIGAHTETTYCRGVLSIYQTGTRVLMNKIDVLNEISRTVEILL
jgi:hypothetical protein